MFYVVTYIIGIRFLSRNV